MDRKDHPRATEAKYRAILAEQARDGLSRVEAAARAGVKPITLNWWRCELVRRDRRRRSAENGPNASAFLPVRVRELAPPVVKPIPSTPYEVVFASGWVVRVPRDFEGASIQALVRALGALEGAPC